MIIAILLIANIAMLAFFLQKKTLGNQAAPQDKKAFIVALLKEEVGFSKDQLVKYDTLSNRHREKIGRLYDNIRNNKTVQFKKLAAVNFNDSAISELAEQSTASQRVIETNMFNHIKNIRMLCTPEQLSRFDAVFFKIFNWKEEARKKSGK
ncbi:MAG: hypothetical protein WKI04_00480 [Ferruginibacter sp.]